MTASEFPEYAREVGAVGQPEWKGEMVIAKLRAPLKPGEGWGYWVWGTGTVVVVTPEIYAAAGGRSPWPTISATVGHLEYNSSWVALIVVAVIVFVGVHALPDRLWNHARPLLRSSHGRLVQAPRPADVPILMLVIAAGIVGLGSLLAATLDPGDKFVLGYVLWGLMAVFFVALPSTLAYFDAREVPFATLFRTISYLEQRLHFVAVILSIGLVILLIHLSLYPWPSVFHQLQRPTPYSP